MSPADDEAGVPPIVRDSEKAQPGEAPETDGGAGHAVGVNEPARSGDAAPDQQPPTTFSLSPTGGRSGWGRRPEPDQPHIPHTEVDQDPDRTRAVDTTGLAHGDTRRSHASAPEPWAARNPYIGSAPPDAPLKSSRPEPEMFGALSTAQLLQVNKRPPQSGWRYALYAASAGLVNLGESPRDIVRRELVERINHPTAGCHRLAMLSLKGGVGKTAITAALGATLASLRGDRVIALDANPDRGTLSQKAPIETNATVRDLLRDAHRIHRYSDVRAYTSQSPSRLEILASDHDPAVSEAFDETDYRRVVDVVTAHFTLLLTDCGTGLMHSAMKGILNTADALVIVSSASIDGARSASATLDWLDAHDYRALVSRSVAVLNAVPRSPASVDIGRIEDHFAARCRAVCRVPTDPHLAEGAELHLERLHSRTRDALLQLAATVADGFSYRA